MGEKYRSRYFKRVYNNGTVSVNVDSNGNDLCLTLTGACDDNMVLLTMSGFISLRLMIDFCFL